MELIFGAGDFGGRYVHSNQNNAGGVIFVDNDKNLHKRILYGKYQCISPEQIGDTEYDKIVIANNLSSSSRYSILCQLLALGVPINKIHYFPHEIIHENDQSHRVNTIRRCLSFISEQKIVGNMAECGVHTGFSAMYINRFAPYSKLYLFDSFKGFAQRDIDKERSIGNEEFLNSMFNKVGLFSDTSPEIVMKRMMFPENVILKQGWIPESFEGVDDLFCFVHLDMDLYAPMLAALSFFWNRMIHFGILILHNYTDSVLPGVKKAVDDFESQLGRKVTKVPLCADSYICLLKDE